MHSCGAPERYGGAAFKKVSSSLHASALFRGMGDAGQRVAWPLLHCGPLEHCGWVLAKSICPCTSFKFQFRNVSTDGQACLYHFKTQQRSSGRVAPNDERHRSYWFGSVQLMHPTPWQGSTKLLHNSPDSPLQFHAGIRSSSLPDGSTLSLRGGQAKIQYLANINK